jgi:hypothetical protein
MLKKKQLLEVHAAAQKNLAVRDDAVFTTLENLIEKTEKRMSLPMTKETFLSLKAVHDGLLVTLNHVRQLGRSSGKSIERSV